MNEFDVFISYQWDIQQQVRSFYEKLNSKNIKAWRDEINLEKTNLSLTDQLSKGIRTSKIFLCCFTQKYAESDNCKSEINYARELRKPMIVLAIDRPDYLKIEGIGFILSGTIRINCYSQSANWQQDKFDEIKNSIENKLKVKIYNKLVYNHILNIKVKKRYL